MASAALGAMPTRPRRTRVLRPGVWILPPLAALGFAFLYPLALVALQSFSPDDGGHSVEPWREVLASAAFRNALWNTVWIASGATAGCVVLGFFLALVIAFVPFPGARALGRFIDTFLAFPSFLIALALVFIYGSTGMANSLLTGLTGSHGTPIAFLATPWGVLLAEVTYFTPFVMRPLLAAFSQVETAQIETASSLGARPWRIVHQVILPEALPSLAAGGSLALVMCLNEFGIVLFTGAKGVTTLPTLVYSRAILQSDYPAACAIAMVNVLLSVALYGVYRLCLRGRHRRGGSRAGA
ncbi:2-aminoethylphosphonate ABC transporter permease subunit [Kitasatospora sp. NPDC058406]|uniref:2-aminoethylphosphonate ABC transporter permease subunit n=1 Tax=Kitasatospora sp. NPDC058406 TaxID=3346483 RepID=UPI0036564C4D